MLKKILCSNRSLFLWTAAFLHAILQPAHASGSPSSCLQYDLETRTTYPNENSQSSSQSLKFLSYNIQLSGLDIANHMWTERKHVVAELISYADVAALQEISHEQFSDLRGLLPDYEFAGFNSITGKDLSVSSPNTQEGLVIAFRKDAFSLKGSEIAWYSDTPEIPSKTWGTWTGAFPKCLQTATLIFHSDGNELDILNSHFAHDDDLQGNINPRVLSSQYELAILKNLKGRYWISAGDRNFHYPRDSSAYALYEGDPYVQDSKKSAMIAYGETTFFGYEDHARMVPISAEGSFERSYYLDVVFHNPMAMKSIWWLAHTGEYGDELNLLPIGPCQNPSKRRFASDHAAIFVNYMLRAKGL